MTLRERSPPFPGAEAESPFSVEGLDADFAEDLAGRSAVGPEEELSFLGASFLNLLVLSGLTVPRDLPRAGSLRKRLKRP